MKEIVSMSKTIDFMFMLRDKLTKPFSLLSVKNVCVLLKG